MTISQADKAKKFRALHEAPGSFVIPNPWDGGSARVLSSLGFPALDVVLLAKLGWRPVENRNCSPLTEVAGRLL